MNQYENLVNRLQAEIDHEIRERDDDSSADEAIKDIDTRLILLNMQK